MPQASTGFTPFKCLFERQPQGLLDVAKEAWEEQPLPFHSVIENVQKMQTHIDKVAPIFHQHMLNTQAKQSWNNQLAQPQEFQPGNSYCY